eukprot:5804443-Amphidinium_carterae.1
MATLASLARQCRRKTTNSFASCLALAPFIFAAAAAAEICLCCSTQRLTSSWADLQLLDTAHFEEDALWRSALVGSQATAVMSMDHAHTDPWLVGKHVYEASHQVNSSGAIRTGNMTDKDYVLLLASKDNSVEDFKLQAPLLLTTADPAHMRAEDFVQVGAIRVIVAADYVTQPFVVVSALALDTLSSSFYSVSVTRCTQWSEPQHYLRGGVDVCFQGWQ